MQKVKKIVNKIKYDIELVKTMPPMFHTLPGEEFDINKSEVLEWISQHREFAQFVFNDLKNSKLIKYNPNLGTWQGVDYIDDYDK